MAFSRTPSSVRAREHAGPQLAAAVVQPGPHQQRAAIRVDLRVQRLDAGPEALSRQRIDLNLHRQPGLHARQRALGQPVLDPDLRGVLEVDEVGAVLHVVAQADEQDAGLAVERRDDPHARQLSPGQRDLGRRDLQRRRGLVDRALADEVLGDELLVALQLGPRDRRLGLGLLQLCLLQRVVQLHQQLAAPHTLAILEADARDAAADLGSQRHALA
jgi:hypothetical protein